MFSLKLFMNDGSVIDYGTHASVDDAFEHARATIVRWCEESGDGSQIARMAAPARDVVEKWSDGGEFFSIVPCGPNGEKISMRGAFTC